MRRYSWIVIVAAVGCSGDGPGLPGWLFEESTTSTTTAVETTMAVETTTAMETTAVETTAVETTAVETSTGPTAECGNGDVEEGEDCDETDWNGATCESLGFSETGLACVGCQFDVSGCGPPPGMVEVPGGTFEMGSTDFTNEDPIRQVEVNAFWMDETEVTVEAYSGCVDDGECSEPSAGGSCNWMVAGRENHPVNCVTWFQAEEYCGWAGGGTKRLPTEAEWEKTARGTDAREYPWGDSPEPTCSHVVMHDAAAGGSGCGMSTTTQVGSKPLGDSPYGAHDMAGNVLEWVADWYASTHDVAETDNPTGPAMGTSRVLRGGPWSLSDPYYFRAAFRGFGNPASVDDFVGLRCARTPPAPLQPYRPTSSRMVDPR